MTIKVIGTPLSPFVRKVRVCLHEKGMDYEHDAAVGPMNKPDWFVKDSPAGRVPLLYDGDLAVPDSSVICLYLEKKYPETPFYPSDPGDYARALWLEEYSDSVLAAVCGLEFMRPVLFNFFAKKDPDFETCRNTLDVKLPPMLSYLEEQLGDKEWMIGNSFGIADISCITSLFSLYHMGGHVWQDKAPKLSQWFDRVMARESVSKCLEGEAALLNSLNFTAPDFS